MALRGFALSKMRREKTGILDLALSPDLLCNIQIHMIWIKLFKLIARNTNIHLLIQTSTTFILRATQICFGNFCKHFLSFFVHTFFSRSYASWFDQGSLVQDVGKCGQVMFSRVFETISRNFTQIYLEETVIFWKMAFIIFRCEKNSFGQWH